MIMIGQLVTFKKTTGVYQSINNSLRLFFVDTKEVGIVTEEQHHMRCKIYMFKQRIFAWVANRDLVIVRGLKCLK